MGPTLKVLLRYTKQRDSDLTWRSLRDNVFASIYHPDMKFVDVVKVLLAAYTEALMEPRFELPGRHNAAEDLILAPIKGAHAVGYPGPASMQSRYSVEQFYDAVVSKLVSDLRLCRIDWCRGEIWPEDTSLIPTTPLCKTGEQP
ncbi:hypothetical protein VI03_27840 [Burkholderia vietnamiensis]|nr:hypothetical protein VI03_27840 [Burkholderia vietnamiensis]